MDHTAMTVALEACIVNDEEMEHYATTTNEELTAYLDSLPKDMNDPTRSPEELEGLMKRYNAEVVAPKKKGTQVVTTVPKSIMDLSAHR